MEMGRAHSTYGQKDSPTGNLGREKGGEDDRKEDGVKTSHCTWAQQHGDDQPVQEANGYI